MMEHRNFRKSLVTTLISQLKREIGPLSALPLLCLPLPLILNPFRREAVVLGPAPLVVDRLCLRWMQREPLS
jgi:hypothetical protein